MDPKHLLLREKYLARIRPYYEIDTIKVIVGPRRAGKSVILRSIADEIHTDDEHKIFINFEDMDYEDIDNASKLNDLIKGRIKAGRYYLFFDEIQHVKHFEKALASFKSKYDCSIFVTGSNSELLSGELSTLLVGRTREFLIQPFSFSESEDYLSVSGVPKEDFGQYLRLGGYPQRFSEPSADGVRGFLQDLFSAILEKDLFRSAADKSKEKLRSVAMYVLANSGSRFSAQNVVDYLNRVHNSKSYISLQTVYNYLDRMEKAFLIRSVRKYNLSGKGIMDSVAKYYALDNGMVTVNSNSIEVRDTFLLETLVYQELVSREYEVYVGETYKGEVDFVAVKGGKKCFIQVAYLLASPETVDREFGAFSPIKDSSPKYVLSLDEVDMSRNGVVHCNILDFLRGKVDLFLT